MATTGRSLLAAGGVFLWAALIAAPASAQRADADSVCARGGAAEVARACWSIDTGKKVTKWGGLLGAAGTAGLAALAAVTGSDAATAAVGIAGISTGALTVAGVAMEARGYRDLVRALPALPAPSAPGVRTLGVAYTPAW